MGPDSSCSACRSFRPCSPRSRCRARVSRRRSYRSMSRASRRTSSCSARYLAGMVIGFCADACCWPGSCSRSSACTLPVDPTPVIIGSALYVFCVVSFGSARRRAAIPNTRAASRAGRRARRLPARVPCSPGSSSRSRTSPVRSGGSRISSRRATTSSSCATPSCRGGGWPAVWWAVLAIGAIGLVFYVLAWRVMRRMQVKA